MSVSASSDHPALPPLTTNAMVAASRGWAVFRVGLDPGGKLTPRVKWRGECTTVLSAAEQIGGPYGIACSESGLFVVDLDRKPGRDGEAAWARLVAEHGPVPETFTVGTPGGGRHLYFATPAGTVHDLRNTEGALAEGVDTRGAGGYVVGPGSTRPDGRYTTLTNVAVAALPEWIGRLNTEAHRRPGHAGAPRGAPGDLFGGPGHAAADGEEVEQRVRELAEELAGTAQGQGNREVNRIAYLVGQYVGADQIEHGDAQDILSGALTEWSWEHPGDSTTMAETIERALGDGAANPRPWGASTGAGGSTAVPAPAATMAPAHPRTQAILDAAIDAGDLDSLPEPEPLIAGIINAREYVLISGKFGTYKSFVALGWSYALATGQAWSGREVPEPQPVIYVAAEGVSGVRKRVRALERRHGVKIPQGMFTVITRPVHLNNHEEVAGLRELTRQRGAALIVMDTWHRMTPGIEENSATETGGPLDIALQLRDDYSATVLLVHHTGHRQLHARGSSALEDDADAAWIIKLGNGDEDAEGRGQEVARTLVQRKSKDGEVAQPARLRLAVDDQGEASVDTDVFAAPPARPGRPAQADKHEQAVIELIELADAAGLPADLGYRLMGEWDAAQRPGRAATQRAVREAAQARRGRSARGVREGTASGASGASPPKGEGDATQRSGPVRQSASRSLTQLSPAETLASGSASGSLAGVSDALVDQAASETILDAPTLTGSVPPSESVSAGERHREGSFTQDTPLPENDAPILFQDVPIVEDSTMWQPTEAGAPGDAAVLPLLADLPAVPPAECPDCAAVLSPVPPNGLWTACRACTPGSFTRG